MRTPDFIGPWKAWRVAIASQNPPAEVCLAGYLLHCPGAHTFWSWWGLSIVHLRDLPGMQPAVKLYPQAEYELIVYAIDPLKVPHPDPDKPPFAMLTPLDVQEQFHGLSDTQVQEMGAVFAQAVALGHISPDQDFRRMWRVFIRDEVKKRGGGYGESVQ